MPGLPEETERVFQWIREELGPETFVNVMGQYRPAGRVGPDSFEEINRPLATGELMAAREAAANLGLFRGAPA
jgi:putative pyruvate formate lyase activating enzyme